MQAVGRNNMIKNRLRAFCLMFFAITSTMSIADESVDVKHFKDLKKVSLKCHVELLGGQTSIIRHYNLPVRDREFFEKKLLQKGITSGGKTQSIFKVKQCVQIDKKFKDPLINAMDEKSLKNT